MAEPRALYNEIDPYAAAWLRNLISRGLIADGDVAECSIVDLKPTDIAGYTQFHAFAGIGVWSYGLRRAGIADSANVWTGSCPCQPFSAAGKGGGFDDERHLWPAFHHLIRECRPDIVLGEQVASKDGLAWLDLVQSDMEGTDYAFGAIDTCSAGFGAPHIRQRLRFATYRLADDRMQQRSIGACSVGIESETSGRFESPSAVAGLCDFDQLADSHERTGGQGRADARGRDQGGDAQPWTGPGSSGVSRVVADSHDARLEGRQRVPECSDQCAIGSNGLVGRMGIADSAGLQQRWPSGATAGHRSPIDAARGFGWPGPTNGFWSNADWLYCRDGKWRPVEPGTFPLAHGATSRVGRLRAYGNAVDAEATTGFCAAVRDFFGPAPSLLA